MFPWLITWGQTNWMGSFSKLSTYVFCCFYGDIFCHLKILKAGGVDSVSCSVDQLVVKQLVLQQGIVIISEKSCLMRLRFKTIFTKTHISCTWTCQWSLAIALDGHTLCSVRSRMRKKETRRVTNVIRQRLTTSENLFVQDAPGSPEPVQSTSNKVSQQDHLGQQGCQEGTKSQWEVEAQGASSFTWKAAPTGHDSQMPCQYFYSFLPMCGGNFWLDLWPTLLTPKNESLNAP